MDTFRDKRRQDELLRVAEHAAEWLIALEEGGATEHTAFAEWLEESPLHVEMFLRATAVDQIGTLLDPEDRKRLAETAAADDASNVVVLANDSPASGFFRKNATLSPPEAPPSPLAWRGESSPSRFADRSLSNSVERESKRFRRVRWLAGIAAALAAVSLGLWGYLTGPYAWQRYITAVGEQRSVELGDGSVVYVNTDTRIDVHYSEHARDVRLVRGEALFNVERDSARPFRVHLDDTIVQAVGTQFNIYRKATQTTIAVIEGVVQIARQRDMQPGTALSSGSPKGLSSPASRDVAPTAAHKAERLAAGQAASLAVDSGIVRPIPVNVAQVTAWRQRRLVFEWETLGAIAAEFNRYNRTPQIRVEGDGIRARRYTAVFDADSPQTLLQFLARDRDLKFMMEGDELIIR